MRRDRLIGAEDKDGRVRTHVILVQSAELHACLQEPCHGPARRCHASAPGGSPARRMRSGPLATRPAGKAPGSALTTKQAWHVQFARWCTAAGHAGMKARRLIPTDGESRNLPAEDYAPSYFPAEPEIGAVGRGCLRWCRQRLERLAGRRGPAGDAPAIFTRR